MLPQNNPDRIRIVFDDHRLVANAGLLLPATLAQHLGQREARLTQAEVADLTGLSLSAIRRYEYGSANPETGTLDTLARIYDKPAGWFTPRGYFTVKERYQFQQSVRPRAADSRNGDVVIETYDKTREHLSQEAVLRIARFIEFTVRLEVRARTSRPFLGFNREPWRP